MFEKLDELIPKIVVNIFIRPMGSTCALYMLEQTLRKAVGE
jgi:hypothetical protein